MTDDATTTRTVADLVLPLEAADIMRIIPHRYPVLLIDRVIELEPGKHVVAIKNLTNNEPQFTGHFPGRPIMPGVLMVEALAQAGAVAVLSLPEYRGKLALFAGIDECRFKRTVLPGDTLRLEVTFEKLRGVFGRGQGVATVDGEVAVQATLSFIIPRDQSIGGGRLGD
jgi:3-hydroxyacyl-[acyl-carrier-protein] dehydratase